MRLHPGRRWLPATVACLLVAGIFAPLAVFGQSGGSQGQAQLAALVSAAAGSKAYATGVVDYAASSGLSVGAAEAKLSLGNSLLAGAQADLSAGAYPSGIEAAQAAMSDFAAAASDSSVALGNAGLTASADYSAAVSAVAEVNATVNVIASVAAQACAGASGAQGLAQTCAQAEAQVATAGTDLSQAASLLVGSNGQAAASADVPQALSLVAQARAAIAPCQAELATIASFTYVQRGEAYVSAVLDPLYASANATLDAEQSVLSSVTAYQASWSGYSQAQASAAAGVTSAASALGTAISQVDPSSVSSSIGSAQSVAGQVSTEMTALLGITLLGTLYPNVIADVNNCATASGAYSSALASAQNWSGAYLQTPLSGFSSYLSTGTSYAAAVQADGSSYASACDTVVTDLSGLLNVLTLGSLIQPIYSVLSGLQVSPTVSGANSALSQEIAGMSAVEGALSSLGGAVASGEPSISVSASLLAGAEAVSSEGSAYLNATAMAAMGQVYASVQATSQAAGSFISSAQACLQATVGGYAGALGSLGSASSSLGTQTRASARAAATAASYVQSDSQARAAATAAGRADVSQALQLFSAQNVPDGVSALADASLEFRAALGAST